MAGETSKRIVFEASGRLTAALEETAENLSLSKIATIRLAVAILTQITDHVRRGGRVVLRDPDGADREIWLPQLELGPAPGERPSSDERASSG
ncbi:hypothetical protein HQ560_19510 [bacterium]|nr:hypothetical protein [bacterium]